MHKYRDGRMPESGHVGRKSGVTTVSATAKEMRFSEHLFSLNLWSRFVDIETLVGSIRTESIDPRASGAG
jgi:hypothetical protein